MKYNICLLLALSAFMGWFNCAIGGSLIPEWVDVDSRFEVEGTPEDVGTIIETLELMRDSFSPELRDFLQKCDMMGSQLQWLVHQNIAENTNHIFYARSYIQDAKTRRLTVKDFNREALVELATECRDVPPIVRLEFVFDDVEYKVKRAMPGIDYPGVSYEDAGSTSRTLRFCMSAPKYRRNLVVQADVWPYRPDQVDIWWLYSPAIGAKVKSAKKNNRGMISHFEVECEKFEGQGEMVICVFARVKNGGDWGAPSFIRIRLDDLGKKIYSNKIVVGTKFDSFTDWYRLDANGEVMGFSRVCGPLLRGDDYSILGERVVEEYSADIPKTTLPVEYKIIDGKLDFDVLTELRHYKHEVCQPRSIRW